MIVVIQAEGFCCRISPAIPTPARGRGTPGKARQGEGRADAISFQGLKSAFRLSESFEAVDGFVEAGNALGKETRVFGEDVLRFQAVNGEVVLKELADLRFGYRKRRSFHFGLGIVQGDEQDTCAGGKEGAE